MNTIILSKPITKDGNTIAELNLDFDKITGKQIVAAEREVRILGDTTTNVCFSKTFQAIVAAKAASESVIVDDILELPGSDFIQTTTVVANFLFGWIS